jgi:SAM-dependent methyltransferase
MTDLHSEALTGVRPWLTQRLRCPDCHATGLREIGATLVCARCATAFPLTGGRPVLIRTDNKLFSRGSYLEAKPRAARSLGSLGRFAPSRSVNLNYRHNLSEFAAGLGKMGATSVLVIGAGSQKHWLDSFFSADPAIRVVYSDIDINGVVDLFCDAHELPFLDGTFDGIVASAVLEHVVYPERVVAEMHRVLVGSGLIYSEIPFLQQVHEGAYDFTRYTLSGHRRLFNHFEEISSGVVAGPGTTLAWAIEHFALCFTPRMLTDAVRLALRTALFWLKYWDYVFGQSAAAADGASCTFFLGRKSASTRLDSDIVERYAGLRALRHV